MLLFLVGFGIPYNQLISMDMVAFNSLLRGVLELTHTQKEEAAWTALIATAGDGKKMKEWTSRWNLEPEKQQPNSKGFLDALKRKPK